MEAARGTRRSRASSRSLAVCGLVAISRVAIAPALIIQSMLVTKTAATEHSTEAFTWTTSALLAGVGIGLAFGGILLERLPWSAAFVAGAAALLSAAGARSSYAASFSCMRPRRASSAAGSRARLGEARRASAIPLHAAASTCVSSEKRAALTLSSPVQFSPRSEASAERRFLAACASLTALDDPMPGRACSR